MPWRREWLPTPVFLPGEFHGQRSLAGYSPCGPTKSDTNDWLTLYYISQDILHMMGTNRGVLLSRGLISDLFLNRTTEATGGSVVKKTCLPMQHIWVWSLGQEDPLEKEMATCSSFFAWRTPGTEEPGWQETMGSPRVRHDWVNTEAHTLRLLC